MEQALETIHQKNKYPATLTWFKKGLATGLE